MSQDNKPNAMRMQVTVLACLVIVLAGGAYTISNVLDNRSASISAAGTELPDGLLSEPYIVFRSLRPGAQKGHVAIAPLKNPRESRTILPLQCERVAAVERRGVCLHRTRNPVRPFEMVLFDGKFQTGQELPLNGVPSRARLSHDGRYVATTAFVSGHSYTMPGFSTETVIHDVKRDKSYGSLEEFTFLLNGEPHRSVDLNVWGVTFVPGKSRFFATVYSQGRTYLVDGDLEKRTLEALRINAECPSLSPDGRHLVYKKRRKGETADIWRFHVIDLRTGEERPLGETRSIDDQVAWLDNNSVLYGVPQQPGDPRNLDIWVAPIDGGKPRLFIPDADSPSVVR